MKTFALVRDLCCGLVAVGLGVLGLVCDGVSTLFDFLGERAYRAARWLLE